jgi:Spy/CpxP family protein refolding chaperone
MLDENLPTFHFKQSENSLATVLYFSQNGSDPKAEYVLKRADPALPASRNKYAVALTDSSSTDVVYAEVLVTPEWTQPSLSAAEIRAQNGATPPPIPNIPDTVAIQLYNPDQQITLKQISGSWGKSDSWEFEMPEQSFRAPSASRIDQTAADPAVGDVVPKIVFKWKRDGRLSKDMTCYMVGKSVGGSKSKEPDITVALFKQGRNETGVTIYEPNLRRVEVQDRKGLDIVLLLGAEVIRDLFINQKYDVFNVGGAPVTSSGQRKNSRPTNTTTPVGAAAAMGAGATGGMTMSGAIGAANNIPPQSPPGNSVANPPRLDPRRQKEIEVETKRLQAMVAEEQRQQREREKRDQEEQRRIKKMLEQEDKDRRRREAEIEKETERLRKKYGVDGQKLPQPNGAEFPPNLPPRPLQQPPPQQLNVPAQGGWYGRPVSTYANVPARPSSAGPYSHPNMSNNNNSWHRPNNSVQFAPQPQMHPPPPQQNGGRRRNNGVPSSVPALVQHPYAANLGAAVSGLFHRDRSEEDKRKVQKKRSVHF